MDKIRYFPLWLIVLSKLMAAPLRQPDPAQYIRGLDELRSALQVPVHSSTWLRKKLFAWLIAKIYKMQGRMVSESNCFTVASEEESRIEGAIPVILPENGVLLGKRELKFVIKLGGKTYFWTIKKGLQHV